jgi:CxxC-x17-CxxC domain-containing protein
MSDINFFAKTNFRNQERVFGIKNDDRRRHMYIIGKTGMGKTNLLENMAIQDIRSGKGICFIDPHGEAAEKMLKAVPKNRINDVIYFNPADSDFPIAFNILEAVSEDKKNLVTSGMMGVFKKIWPDVWSARMEYILNNTILALLDYPGSTMLGVNRMMSDKEFRNRIYPKIKDSVVKSFWINEFDKWEDKFRKEAVAAIQNKVGQFLSSAVIRHIVGQPKSTIDPKSIMDNQKILIVNLSKGRIGEDAMRLLGGMLVTKIQLAAMERVDMPEAERKDFYLYVDEFQNFATESFANILSEARKYRLNLILANQYINQLIFDGNSTVRDAVFGNVGTLVSFRVGAEDAEHLEKEFEPVFLINDIVNLTKYNIYLKLMIDGIAGDAFSATVLPPVDLSDTEINVDKVIKASRERYGRSRIEVEDKISRWSGMEVFKPEILKREAEKKVNSPVVLSEKKSEEKARPAEVIKNTPVIEEAAVLLAANESIKKVKEEIVEEKKGERKMYETICSSCEEKITVPFKPDPSRPAFCKECLKEYQRMMAKVKNEEAQKSAAKDNFQKEGTFRRNESKDEKKVNIEPLRYVPREKPLSLSQMAHIEPKKFKNSRKKIEVDLKGLRRILDNTKNKKNAGT